MLGSQASTTVSRVGQGRWPLVLLVGPEGPARANLATELIDQQLSVVVCPGPPPCPFLRGESCQISPAADVVVFLRTTTPKGAVGTGLIRCGMAARRLVVAGRAGLPMVEADASVSSLETQEVADAIMSVLEAPISTRRSHT